MLEKDTTIELASYADAVEIARLSRDTVEAGLGWKWTPRRVRRAIKNRSINVVVAKNDHVLQGFGIMRYGRYKANLDLLAVRPDARRAATGTRIVRWLEHVAVTAGIFHTYVQLREKNTAARRFYARLGYEEIDIVPGYYRGLEAGVVMYRYSGVPDRFVPCLSDLLPILNNPQSDS